MCERHLNVWSKTNPLNFNPLPSFIVGTGPASRHGLLSGLAPTGAVCCTSQWPASFSYDSASNIFTLLNQMSAMVTVYGGHSQILFILPRIISLFIKFVKIIRNNDLVSGCVRAKVWTSPPECVTLYCTVMKIRWFASQNATYFRVLVIQFDICAHSGANHYTPCTRKR